MEVRVTAAPVGDLGEGVSGQDVLRGRSQVRWKYSDRRKV